MSVLLMGLLVLSIRITIALECYQCAYFEGLQSDDINGLPHTDSCISGDKLNKSMSVTCEDQFFIPVRNGTDESLVANPNSSRRLTTEDMVFTCAKLTYNGKQLNGKNGKVTMRTCVEFDSAETKEYCYSNTNRNLKNDTNVNPRVKLLMSNNGFDDDATVGFCSCNKDYCNDAARHASGHHLSTFGLLVANLLFFKKMYLS